MSIAAVTPLREYARAKKTAVSEAQPGTATPAMLRSVAQELTISRSGDAFTSIIGQFERHAVHLEAHHNTPLIAVTKDLVTVTEHHPIGTVLVVPAPACDSTTIGTHIAAALTAGNHLSLVTLDPVDGVTKLFHEVLAHVLTSRLFTLLSPGTGWETSASQSIVVITPDDAFANDQPWWRHHNCSSNSTDLSTLVQFYERLSTITVPYRTSPYRENYS